jgi:hypothetical protein
MSTVWLWPDHVIGKRESRRLREEHNALANSHAVILAALRDMTRWVEGLATEEQLDRLDGRARYAAASKAIQGFHLFNEPDRRVAHSQDEARAFGHSTYQPEPE